MLIRLRSVAVISVVVMLAVLAAASSPAQAQVEKPFKIVGVEPARTAFRSPARIPGHIGSSVMPPISAGISVPGPLKRTQRISEQRDSSPANSERQPFCIQRRQRRPPGLQLWPDRIRSQPAGDL